MEERVFEPSILAKYKYGNEKIVCKDGTIFFYRNLILTDKIYMKDVNSVTIQEIRHNSNIDGHRYRETEMIFYYNNDSKIVSILWLKREDAKALEEIIEEYKLGFFPKKNSKKYEIEEEMKSVIFKKYDDFYDEIRAWCFENSVSFNMTNYTSEY